MKKLKIGLATQIIIALILGSILGIIFYGNPKVTIYLQPFSDIFIRLIKMIVVPIILSSLIVGIAGSDDSKHIGRMGVKTIVYFEIMSVIAILLGLAAAIIFKPGAGLNLNLISKASDISKFTDSAKALESHGFISTFVNIVPTNIIQSLANGELLAIVFFAVFFAMGLNVIGEKKKVIVNFFEGVSTAMFWVTNQVMKVAPIGVFATMAITVSKFGVKSLIPMGKLVLCCWGCILIYVFVFDFLAAKLFRIKFFRLIKVIKDELALAFSTASSETVLPKIIEKTEKFGGNKATSTFVIPLGYTFNLDGAMLYIGMAVLFIAQIYNIHLSTIDLIKLILILLVTTKGAAGVAGGAFVIIIATLVPMGLPVEGIALVIGIDRIMDMGRTATNVFGNALASLIISRWEGTYDDNKAEEYYNSLKTSEIEA